MTNLVFNANPHDISLRAVGLHGNRYYKSRPSTGIYLEDFIKIADSVGKLADPLNISSNQAEFVWFRECFKYVPPCEIGHFE